MERPFADIAARQFGLLSRDQLASLGITKSMLQTHLARGRLVRITHNVFRVAGSPLSSHQMLMAAQLRGGPRATLSHRSAGTIWRFPQIRFREPELILPRNLRRSISGIDVHWLDLTPADIVQTGPFRVTEVGRTLFDLASIMPKDMMEEALDDALRRGLVSKTRLRWRLMHSAGLRGSPMMRALIEARSRDVSVPGSVLETRLLRLLRRAGLPGPSLQHKIKEGGRLIAVVDFAYPDARVVIEAEGYQWHSGLQRWQHDLARRNDLTNLGWRVIHVTWADVESRPDQVIESIRAAL